VRPSAADIRTGIFARKALGLREGPARILPIVGAGVHRARGYFAAMLSVCSPGLRLISGYVDRPGQETLAAEIAAALERAPLYTPRMPRSGRPFSVRMSNCGVLGWVSDAAGYRYQPTHPETGRPWPAIPRSLLAIWQELSGYPHPPEACLINFYASGTRMGLHQDRDEADFSAPVLSVSLGDTCVFRLGGLRRTDPTRSLELKSGDALVLGGEARLAFHGVERVLAGTSTLLPHGGRINLTMRRVTLPR
jgi:DNA oxidative demethylase